ncbi:UNVERIFIED_CONTAM: hypothetical protein HDU68_008564 [Siphonaria sp. JEL0065]|nr:hypothetical protein HDU68_008564 [Siphonaria sp. JEL0065]
MTSFVVSARSSSKQRESPSTAPQLVSPLSAFLGDSQAAAEAKDDFPVLRQQQLQQQQRKGTGPSLNPLSLNRDRDRDREIYLFSSSVVAAHIDDYLLVGKRKISTRITHDRISFARIMRLDSKDFMDFWKFCQADQTIRNLIFYKEVSFLEDNLSAMTPATQDQCNQYSRARNAGLTPSMIRFLVKESNDMPVLFSSKDPIAKLPTIPVTSVPPELKYNYETIINSFILSPNSQISVPLALRNGLFSLVTPQSGDMRTSVLDECIDVVLDFLYSDVFRRYVSAIAEYQQSQQSQTGSDNSPPTRYSMDQSGRSSSMGSSFRSRTGNGGLYDTVMTDDEFIHVSVASFGAATPRLAKRLSDHFTPSSWKEDEDVGTFNHVSSGNSRKNPGPVSRSGTINDGATVMLYVKPTYDERQFNLLMDLSGFMERKDPEPVQLEFSRSCFVKVMDTTSVSYRDFSQFAKINGWRNHINFLDQIQTLDDTLASLTPIPASNTALVKQYARARNDHAITQPLSRFIQSTPATDPSYTRLQKLPQLPPIPAHPVPASLKTTFINIYGTFIGRDSSQEIQFTLSRRPGVQSALQQDFMRPIESDLLDGCADDCLESLYENGFRAYVVGNGGKISSGNGVVPTVVAAVATGSPNIAPVSNDIVGAVSAPNGVIGGNSVASGSLKKASTVRRNNSISGSSGSSGGFFSGLFGKGRSKRNGSSVSTESKGSSPSPVAPVLMLYDLGKKEPAPKQLMDVSLTYSSFLNTMRVDGPLFKQFKMFSETDHIHGEGIGNLNFYQAVSGLEDQLAATTPSPSVDDAVTYRSVRAEGLNQTLSRFIHHVLETNPFGSGDLTTRTLLPPIPVQPVHSNLKSQCVDIFNTYVSENAPVRVSISAELRQQVKAAINDDNFATNVFNDCMDHIVKSVYSHAFMRFVGAKNISRGGLALHPYPNTSGDSVLPSAKHEPLHQSTPQASLTSILKSKSASAALPSLSVLGTGRKAGAGSLDSPRSSMDSPMSPKITATNYFGSPLAALKTARNPPPPLAPSAASRSVSRNKAVKPDKPLVV